MIRYLGNSLFALRTASARMLVPFALAVGVVQVFQGGSANGEWDDGLRLAVNQSWYAALAVAVGSALDAYRMRRHFPTITQACRPLLPAFAQVGANALWGIAVLALLSSMALASAAAVSPWRTPNFGITGVGVTWMLESAALGWAVGWFLPYYVSIPAMILIVWLGNAVLATDTDGAAGLLSGIYDGVFPAGIQPVTPVLLAQMLMFASVGLLFVVLTRWAAMSSRARSTSGLALVVGLAVAFVTVGLVGPNRGVELRDAAGPKVCSSRSIEVCSWPDHDQGRRLVFVAAERMWAPLRAAGADPPKGIADAGLRTPDDWIGVPIWPPYDSPTLASNLARQTLAWYWCDSAHSVVDGGNGTYDRQLWLEARVRRVETGVPESSAREQVKWLLDKPEDAACIER